MKKATAAALHAARRVRLIPHGPIPLEDAIAAFRRWTPTGRRRYAAATLRGEHFKEPVLEVARGHRRTWVRTEDWRALCALGRSLDPPEATEDEDTEDDDDHAA